MSRWSAVMMSAAISLGMMACNSGSSGGGGSSTPDGGAGGSPDAGGCEPGTQGCACNMNTCASGLQCVSEVCVPANCSPGTLDCVCADGNTCEGALSCEGGVCQMAEIPADALQVQGNNVRGCDVMFTEGDTKVAEVRFNDGVVGQFLRRDGKVALSFMGANGGTLSNVGAIVLEGGQVATSSDLQPSQMKCVGADGQPVDGAMVVLQ
ncbi:MAG: hypothetical protein ACE366_18420 [Bradymonadia bacterium]